MGLASLELWPGVLGGDFVEMQAYRCPSNRESQASRENSEISKCFLEKVTFNSNQVSIDPRFQIL